MTALLGRRAVDRPQLSRVCTVRAGGVGRRRDVLDRQSPACASAKATSRRTPRSSVPRSRSAQRTPGLTAEQLEPLYYRDALRLDRARTRSGGSACSCAQGLLHGRAGRPVVYATLDVVRRRVGRCRTCCCCRSRARGLAVTGVATRRRRRCSCWPPPRSSPCLVFFPQERFRIPVIDPALIVCAAAAWRLDCAWNRCMNVLVVVPTYNERENLPLLVARRARARRLPAAGRRRRVARRDRRRLPTRSRPSIPAASR